MTKRLAMGACAFTAIIAVAVAGEALESGPQTGKTIPGPFHPLNVTGGQAGKKHCLVWQHGANPVAMIFARSNSDALTSLVKKLDAATAENKSKRMGSFVVYLSDDEALEDQLKTYAEKNGIKNTVFAIDNVAGPKGYNVAKDADVTVVLYNKRKVEANHAFKKGELNAKAVDAIVSELPKIVGSN